MMIVIIHELNHYLRCVKRKDVKIEDCSTGRTQSVEGGELMFNEIFGVDYINKLDFLLQKEIMNAMSESEGSFLEEVHLDLKLRKLLWNHTEQVL